MIFSFLFKRTYVLCYRMALPLIRKWPVVYRDMQAGTFQWTWKKFWCEYILQLAQC